MKNKRYVSFDLMKGIALLFMIFIHIPMYLTVSSDKSNAIYFIINSLAMISAPIFLFIVGMNIRLFIDKRKKDSNKLLVKRSILLIVIGLIFTLFWTSDIIHFIGFFMLFSIIVLRLNKWLRILLVPIVLSISHYLIITFDYTKNWVAIPYVYLDFWTFEGFLTNLFFNGVYAFFPWVCFVILGDFFGEIFIESIKKKKENEFIKKGFIFGLCLLVIGFILRLIFNIEIDFYPVSISYFLISSGIVIMMMALFFYMFDSKRFKSNNIVRSIKNISIIGSMSLSYYILHIFLGLIYFNMTNSYNNYSLTFSLIYALLLTSFLSIGLFFFKKRFGNGPLELIVRKLL